jgi:hypothetical protein
MPNEIISSNDKKVYAMEVMDNFLSEYSISSGKERVKSPTEMLLENADDYNVSKIGIDIPFYRRLVNSSSGLTLYKKLLLGLPLTYAEASYINMLYTSVSSGERVDFVRKLQKRL